MDEIMLALINSSQSLRIAPRDTSTMISSYTNLFTNQTRLFVSGRSPECSDCLLRFMEQ